MPSSESADTARWRKLANELRIAAKETADPEKRRRMLLIALAYDRLSDYVEKR